MHCIAKPVMVAGLAGALALASVTPSDARVNRWAAAGIGFLAGAAVASAAAHAHGYYGPGYYYEPSYAYDPAPAYVYEPTYVAPVYAAPTYIYSEPTYAYDPAYRTVHYGPSGYYAYAAAPRYRYGTPVETRSWPPHYDPGAGYNSNTVSPWQDRRLQGADY